MTRAGASTDIDAVVADLLRGNPQGLTTQDAGRLIGQETTLVAAALARLASGGQAAFGRDRRWRSTRVEATRSPSTPVPDPTLPGPSKPSGPAERLPASVVATASRREIRSIEASLASDLDDPIGLLKRLLPYYRDSVKAELEGGIGTFPDRLGATALLLAPDRHWWPQGETGAEIVVPRSALDGRIIAALGRVRREPVLLGYPLEIVALRDGGVLLRPVALLPAAWTLDSDTLRITPQASGLQANPDWLKYQRKRFPDQAFLLEQLGLGATAADAGDDAMPSTATDDIALVARRLADLFAPTIREPLDPARLDRLPTEAAPGLYNRLLLTVPEVSPFARNLGADLATLDGWNREALASTALATVMGAPPGGWSPADPALIDLIELNPEQMAAARDALEGPLTVITGPPGSGKSQVVAAVMAAAAAAGRTAVLASRNHAAVDAVQERLDALSNDRPLCLLASHRFGEEQPFRLSRAVDLLLSRPAQPGAQDALRATLAPLQALDRARAAAEAEMVAIEEAADAYAALELRRDAAAAQLGGLPEATATRLANAPAAPQAGWADQLPVVGDLIRRRRIAAWLRRLRDHLGALAQHPGVPAFEQTSAERWSNLAGAAAELQTLDGELRDVRSRLPGMDRREQVAQAAAIASERIRAERERLIRSLSAALDDVAEADRLTLTNLRGALPLGESGAGTGRNGWGPQAEVLLRHFPLWSSTSLSVGGRLPLQPGLFDLVIIDEASQHDIAAALPLLARARAAVIVGDPAQLPHVSRLAPGWEADAVARLGLQPQQVGRLLQGRTSLFHLASSSPVARRHLLREHFRCHPDIADFISDAFYRGALRVRTDVAALRPPPGQRAGLHWTRVESEILPGTSGCHAPGEAEAIVAESLRLLQAGYEGTIGIVTPFAEQQRRINDKIMQRVPPGLREKADLRAATAHRFQGDARDVILVSLCAGEGMPSGSRAFLRDNPHLINVAVSRARAVCHVIGNDAFAAVSGIPHLERLARAAQQAATARTGTPFESPWEERLYRALAAAGISAMPQYPIAGRRLDLAVIKGTVKLDIEVDGDRYHRDASGLRRVADLWRDRQLTGLGWQVLRFWVYELREDMDGCVGRIRAALAGS
jgi:very-short-patch-repair endonuclease